MRRAHGSHVVCSFAEQMRATYMQLSTAGASPPPLLPAAFPPCGNLFPQTDVAPLSPRAGPHCFPAYANVHGCYDPPRIVYWFDRVHIGGVAEACFVLLPRTTYRDTRTWIVSSSLDPGSLAERISSSLALCPPFDLASGQSSSPVFGQGFFLPWWGPSSAFQGQVDNLSLCPPHGWHVALRIADQTVKTYIGFVAGDAAPYPPPSDPRLATPDFGRILLPRPGSIRSGASPPPLRRTILRFGFGPIIGLQLRLEPLFLPKARRLHYFDPEVDAAV